MKLKKFVEKLEKIAERYGTDTEVRMADDVSVVDPIYLVNFISKKVVVITDQK